MVAEVYAGLSAIKTAFDMAKGLKDIHDATLRNAAVIELQEKILAAQEAQSTLVDRARDLEQEVARLKDWEAEKERYQLRELPPGVFVYELKDSMANREPRHSTCQACYQRGKKSILHSDQPGNGIHHLTCHECGNKLRVGILNPPRQTRTRYDPFGRDYA